MNPYEGRAPVSWNECADEMRKGWRLWINYLGDGWRGRAADPDRIAGWPGKPVAGLHLLLPPPGLVPAPEGMDGGGWLGQGKDVPDGWPCRAFADGTWMPGDLRPAGSEFVQCRPPAPKREPEWVPLTKLVGRTVWGETRKVDDEPLHFGGTWHWTSWSVPGWLPFPDGTLDLDTGRVKVEPEGEQ